jgi:hypothetical protein
LQVEWALWSVLKMKRVNKKEPKGSGLHRFNKAFLCSIEFCTFFYFRIAMNDNVAQPTPS